MMKRVLTILITVLCLTPVYGLMAQEYTQTPVTVSKEKIRDSDGKVYYSHVVQERQTLFSIAKAYGVSVDDIYEANKDLDLRGQGLKKNSIIRIPAAAGAQTTQPQAQQTQQQKVQEAVSNTVSEVKDGVVTHVVKWYEDINDIAQKYKVSVESILKANGLKDGKKVKSRMVLKIPQDQKITVEEEAPVDVVPVTPDPQPVVEEEKEEKGGLLDDFIGLFTKKSTVNAVLMLPLNASGTPSATNMDFYSGFLMGIKDLGDKGVSTNLSVYDVSNGSIPVTAAKLEESDVVIGPLSVADLTKVLAIDAALTPVVSPLDQKAESLVDGHDHFIQAPTSYNVQYEDMVKWIKEDMKNGDKVIVISEKGAKNTSINTTITSNLSKQGISFTPYSYSILQGRNAINALTGLIGSGCNRFIIASDSEAFVNDVVRNLNQLVFHKHNVVLYSSSRIRSYNTIDVENFHAVNLHASLSYYIDYDDPRVQKFLLEYRALYGTEPTRFSFQGYDLARYFIGSCAEYGNKWLRSLPVRDGETLLQSQFLFAEQEDGGLVNQGIRRIVYESDYKVKLAD